MTSSGASGVVHPDIEQVIRNVAFEMLKTMPVRLLHTPTGILCDRNTQVSHFMDSRQCKRLVSLCSTCSQDQQMELIRTDILRHFQYIMLSHRWGEDEPSLRAVEGCSIYGMSTRGGFGKLQAFCRVALERDYLWAWSDTCCIDKYDCAEVQETIGSMFTWYRQSALTIVYLSDISDAGSLGSSEWFRRGWTLQEPLAPRTVLFYTQNWSLYKNLVVSNHEADVAVLEEVARETGIESQFLTNFSPGMDDARLILQWASSRRTTRPEDIALFAFRDLQRPSLCSSGKISVLDWVGEPSPFHSCFPAHIASYQRPPALPSYPNTEEQPITMSQGPSSFEVMRNFSGSLATSLLPCFLSRSLTLSSVAHRVPAVQQRTPDSYSPSNVYDFHSLTRVPHPRILNRLLILPCIAYRVIAVQLSEPDPSRPNYMYHIQASGLKPLEITSPIKLEDIRTPEGALHLVGPWHSKLLGPSVEPDAVTEEQLVSALGTPFNALLLTQLSHHEYKRIASSTLITVQSVDQASILESKVRILNVV
ncbi:hypothetical protein BKA83DRAFT_10461 [Pisolithus microcarpus]|nr:hypothetical protein BKA83DRAFT_10461 [Pisolithus microcarpus]